MSVSAEKIARLVGSSNGGEGRPAMSRAPTRAVVPQHTPAQMANFVQKEQAILAAQRAAATQETPIELPVPSTAVQSEKPAEAAAVTEVSSYDAEVLEMSEALDPGELMLNGRIVCELEILPGILTVTAQSLKKAESTEIQRDIDRFGRGVEDPDNKTEKLLPTRVMLMDFANLRQLSTGILAVNGKPLSAGEWAPRSVVLENLGDAAYHAIRREYGKFLQAVGMLFPDKAQAAHIARLKEAVGKAQAHP